MDRGAWQATVHSVTELDTTEATEHTHTHTHIYYSTTQRVGHDWATEMNWTELNHTIALISHASKVMLKILQARLQQYMNRELPDV